MPSFARADNPYADPLENVWKNKEVDVVGDLIKDSRIRAAHILRTVFPSKVTQLRELIASYQDESSPFWKGHVHKGDYIRPTMLHWSAEAGAAFVAGHEYKNETGSGSNDEHREREREEEEEEDILQGKRLARLSLSHKGDEGRAIVLPADIARIYPTVDKQSESEIVNGDRDQDGDGDDKATIHGISKSVPAAAERKVTHGVHYFEVVPRNKVQSQCIEIALREFEEFYDLVNELKLWLECEIPQIEDGNSFGTEIQQHLITQLINTNKAVVSWENAVRQHWTDRAKYVSEWLKTPNVQDWESTIASSDRFDHHLIRGYLMRALTTYVGLLTKFERNWEKVVWPKGKQGGGGGTVGMY